MLKDRRVLLENEIAKQRALCGRLYIRMIQMSESSSRIYDEALEKLSRMMTELTVINQMIEDGNP